MDMGELKEHSTRLGLWAHIATVGADNAPDVVPVHPCWEGDTLWIMVGTDSVKAKNLAANPEVALHWQVGEGSGFDSLMIWGTASLHDDLDTKRRLWTGVFDYDLNAFAPGGPDDSPGTTFVAVRPTRATLLRNMGMGGRDAWRA